jgi:hypothetical protein
MATSSHLKHGGASRRLLSAALISLVLGGSAATLSSGSAYADTTVKNGATYAYSWPVKPFDQPHPVRGSFGDPRTLFAGPPTQRTLLSGNGSFQFHDGIDISAPDGTAVYPVESGTVRMVTKDWVEVESGNRSFQYWHITPNVTVGQQVDTDLTVLGHIIRSCGHVHLTEMDGNVPVNPLAPGHLGPYTDTTTPTVASVAFRQTVTSGDLMPELLRGRVEIIASAYDMPSLPVKGTWHDLPVTPALVEWRIQHINGKVVVPTRVIYDVRQHLPAFGDFWRIYARGTHQNMSVFGKHYSFMQPGAYFFRLAPGGFDTHTLRDDVYELVVTAIDIAGNQSSDVQRFSVHNRPGVVGP